MNVCGGNMKRYKVYRNLHNGQLSVGCCKTNLVVGYVEDITLFDVVGKTGQQRVRETKQKNVHAFVEGVVCGYRGFVPREGRELEVNFNEVGYSLQAPRYCTYNPYTTDFWQYLDDNSYVPERVFAASVYHNGQVLIIEDEGDE